MIVLEKCSRHTKLFEELVVHLSHPISLTEGVVSMSPKVDFDVNVSSDSNILATRGTIKGKTL